jgi:hypothetical protein
MARRKIGAARPSPLGGIEEKVVPADLQLVTQHRYLLRVIENESGMFPPSSDQPYPGTASIFGLVAISIIRSLASVGK